MKVFISSVIRDFELFREAAAEAIRSLGHTPTRAEDFAALTTTPQSACLAGIRDADLVVLLLGARYGEPHSSGLSATHEEYQEAAQRKPLLAFVQNGGTREPEQAAFIAELQTWDAGTFTRQFDDAPALQRLVIQALHGFELSQQRAPFDEGETAARAVEILQRRTARRPRDASLIVGVALGPAQAVLRPAEIEEPGLARDLQHEVLFGTPPVFVVSDGTQTRIEAGALVLEQERASLLVDPTGAIRLMLPARVLQDGFHGIPDLIEEDIRDAIARAQPFIGRMLDRIDPTHRLTHAVPVVGLSGGSYLPWRTREEHDRDPNSATMGRGGDEILVQLAPPSMPRAALTHRARELAEDFTVLLRRELRG